MLDKYYEMRAKGYGHLESLEELKVSFEQRIQIEDHLYNRQTEQYKRGNAIIVIVSLSICVVAYYIGKYLLG